MSIESTKIYYFGLPSSGIVSQPIRLSDVLKLKKLKSDMSYQLDFLLHLSKKKYHAILGYDPKILLANQLAMIFFTFDLFDLINLITGGHCYIVLVSFVLTE